MNSWNFFRVEITAHPFQLISVLHQVGHAICQRQFRIRSNAHLEAQQALGHGDLPLRSQYLGLKVIDGQVHLAHRKLVCKPRFIHRGYLIARAFNQRQCFIGQRQTFTRSKHKMIRFCYLLHDLIGSALLAALTRFHQKLRSLQSKEIRTAENQLRSLHPVIGGVALAKLKFGKSIRIEGRGINANASGFRNPAEKIREVSRESKDVSRSHLCRNVNILAVIPHNAHLGQPFREHFFDIAFGLLQIQRCILHRKCLFQGYLLCLLQRNGIHLLARSLEREKGCKANGQNGRLKGIDVHLH